MPDPHSDTVAIKFDRHGLGDCCHFAQLLQLWIRRGFDVTVQAEENKLPLWRAAGIKTVQGGDLPDHAWVYPEHFEDLDYPDWQQNKVAHGILHPALPQIGDQRELWDELIGIRMSADLLITPENTIEACTFLEGLPRPLVCLHTRGSNWQARKSLPIETAFDLVLRLLRDTSGSVISLDFDRREPIVAHERCRGIVPSWGMISIDRLAALLAMCDLMIGVDSGPFHFASLYTDVPCIGVFREIHPVRCCLPSPHTVYMVSDDLAEYWAEREQTWHFALHPGTEPTAAHIAELACDVLAGRPPMRHPLTRMQRCDDAEVAAMQGKYVYRRVGHDERVMRLLPEGVIGRGAGSCERRWKLCRLDGQAVLTILGDDRTTCHLMRDVDGVWRGRWLIAERMPIELVRER